MSYDFSFDVNWTFQFNHNYKNEKCVEWFDQKFKNGIIKTINQQVFKYLRRHTLFNLGYRKILLQKINMFVYAYVYSYLWYIFAQQFDNQPHFFLHKNLNLYFLQS